MTKKQTALLNQYNRATARTLYDVYGRYSYAKEKAYNWCIEKMNDLNGFDGRICSATCNFFTFAFQYPDPETGVLRLCYETHRNTYDFEIA